MAQFVEPLAELGIELDISPFLNDDQFRGLYQNNNGILKKALGLAEPVAARFGKLFEIKKYDLVFVQREAMIFGPAIFEWLYKNIGQKPVILDLDDATYVRYVSPTYGRVGSFFKFFGKTDNLIKRADAVICGNRFIAEHVESLGTKSVVIPTVVDTDKFCPIEKNNAVPVFGWIGTHSTFPFLRSLFPVLEKLAEKHKFVLKIVGAGEKDIEIKGVEIINVEWDLDREIEDFQSLDIGLYPMTLSDSANAEWLQGKSGFKAIQYMAVGLPFVMTPIGIGAEIGKAGKTHFNAQSDEDWYNLLDKLLSDSGLRTIMGAAGRGHAIEHYTIPIQAGRLTKIIKSVNQKSKASA
jgi:glycosyltransferase involved in cell wall biosynthesis